MFRSRFLANVVIVFGVLALVVGIAFIGQGVIKQRLLTTSMRQEQVTLGLSEDQIKNGGLIDSATEAQLAGDTIRTHRHSIAPTYEDLLAGGKFDPTNPQHVLYAQAMNMENYLYLAVLGFGLVTEVTVSGIFMVITGLALGAIGISLRRLNLAGAYVKA